jgi:soluble lytic murein transglycosylase-like protein
MSFDLQYHYDTRLIVRISVLLSVLVASLALWLATDVTVTRTVAPAEIWAYVNEQSAKAKLSPDFVYAIVWAESSLDPSARSSVARGMMQLTRSAWREVTNESYRQAWDWRTNIRVGVGYLSFCRDFLQKRDAFNYSLLAASYLYGPYYVQNKNFDMAAIKRPRNKIYQRLVQGDVTPVERPVNVSVSQVP